VTADAIRRVCRPDDRLPDRRSSAGVDDGPGVETPVLVPSNSEHARRQPSRDDPGYSATSMEMPVSSTNSPVGCAPTQCGG